MDRADAIKNAVAAIGNLIGSYPEGSEQAKALEGVRGVILDVVLELKVSDSKDELTRELYNAVGLNAISRLQSALNRRKTDNAVADLLERSALLDAVTKHVEG